MGRSRSRATQVLASAIISAMLLVVAAGPAAAAKVIGDWKLKGGLKNAAGTQLKMAKVGDVIFETADVKGVDRKALVFDEGEGLRLSKVPKAARGSYSISVLFEFDATDGYRRILSFGPNTNDYGLYVEDAFLDLYDKRESGVVTGPDQWIRVHVTRAGKTGRMNVYVDGVKALTFKDAGGRYKLKKGVAVFFQDNLVGAGTGEHPSGTAAGIKVWKGAKTP